MATYINRTFSGYSFECFRTNPFTGQSEPFSMFVPVGEYDKAYKIAVKQVAGIGTLRMNPDTLAPECTAVDNELRRMKLEDFYRLSELVPTNDDDTAQKVDEETCDEGGNPPASSEQAETTEVLGTPEDTLDDSTTFNSVLSTV